MSRRSESRAVRRCIYCLSDKAETEFNREHVIPESFGLFEHNLVLDCVCTSCNDFFGKELDLKLARDSVEGWERYASGMKKVRDFKSLGKRSTTNLEVMKDGPMRGVLCELVPNDTGTELNSVPLPQVGFGWTPEGPFEFHLIDRLPDKAETMADRPDGASQVHLRTWGVRLEDAWPALKAKGWQRGESTGTTQPENGRVESHIVFRISHPEFRAFAKIAFNYFAYEFGAKTALLPNFNEIRRYVRWDARPNAQPVDLAPAPVLEDGSSTRRVQCHYAAVERRGPRIFARVGLFSRFSYIVALSRDPLVLEVPMGSAHIWDLEAREVRKH